MTSEHKTTEIHEMTGPELDRLKAHYVHTGKQLRARAVRELFTSIFSFKTKTVEKTIVLPGSLVSSTR